MPEGDDATVAVTVATEAGGRRPADSRTLSVRLVEGTASRSDFQTAVDGILFTSARFERVGDAWSATDSRTIRIADDDLDEDDEEFDVRLEWQAPRSSDILPAAQAVVIVDDDTRGVTVSETALRVAEGGRKATVTVVLDSEPTARVTVIVDSVADVQSRPEDLYFTPDNWSEPQSTAFQAVDDALVEGPETVSIKLYASGGDYDPENEGDFAAEVAVTVTDNDVAGMTVEPTALAVTEGDATGATYTVALTAQPSDIVRVTVGGATTDLTVDKTRLTFDSGNWSAAQTVTVTAGEDTNADDETVSLTHTADGGGYDSVAGPSVAVAVTDNDRPGLAVSTATLALAEGGSGRYTVALVTQPTDIVKVTASGQGTDLTVSPETLTFTTANWQRAQSVTVAAVEDDDAGDEAATLTHAAAGGDYAGVTATVAVTVDDDEIASLVLSETELTLAEGASGNYTVAPGTPPTGDVTVEVTGQAGTDLRVAPATLTFGPADWSAKRVTVTAGPDDDSLDDTVTLTHLASGAEYADVGAVLTVEVTDDDVPRPKLVLNKVGLDLNEGESGTYTVALNTEPTDGVTVTVSGYADTDVTVSKTSLTFTTSNWADAQTITVTAPEDDDAAGARVPLAHTARGDADYAALDPIESTLNVRVFDDEVRGLVVTPASLSLDEGASVTYTVALNSEPTAPVTITVSGYAGTDLTVAPTVLTFKAADWADARTLTVKAGEDADTADDAETLTHTAAGAWEYAHTEPLEVTVPVEVIDDDAGAYTPVAACSGALWSATMTVGGDTTGRLYRGYGGFTTGGSLSPDRFGFRGTDYVVELLEFRSNKGGGPAGYDFELSAALPSDATSDLTLHAGGRAALALDMATSNLGDSRFGWTGSDDRDTTDYAGTFPYEVGSTVDVCLVEAGANRAPSFADGDTATRSVAENTGAGEPVGEPVAATDADGDTLTYSLDGADADCVRARGPPAASCARSRARPTTTRRRRATR